MFCPNCGSNMNDNVVFCPNCGYNKNVNIQKPKKSLGFFGGVFNFIKRIVVICIIIAVLCIIFSAIYILKFNGSIDDIKNIDYKTIINNVRGSNGGAENLSTEESVSNETINSELESSVSSTQIKVDEFEQFSNQVKEAYLVSQYKPDTKVAELGSVEFGRYPQDSSNSSDKKPIEWLVLAKDEANHKVLLISKYILDCKSYNDDGKPSSWENCTLRYWLNNDFCNMAFTSDELNKIEPTLLNNAGNSAYKVFGGNNTYDKVFELSIDEVELFFAGGTINVATKATNYAKTVENAGRNLWVYNYAEDTADDKHFYEWADGNSSFWLRSPGNSLDTAACVSRGGEIVKYGYSVHSQVYGIRPAMWVSY